MLRKANNMPVTLPFKGKDQVGERGKLGGRVWWTMREILVKRVTGRDLRILWDLGIL